MFWNHQTQQQGILMTYTKQSPMFKCCKNYKKVIVRLTYMFSKSFNETSLKKNNIHSNLNSANTDGSFTMANSNSF